MKGDGKEGDSVEHQVLRGGGPGLNGEGREIGVPGFQGVRSKGYAGRDGSFSADLTDLPMQYLSDGLHTASNDPRGS